MTMTTALCEFPTTGWLSLTVKNLTIRGQAVAKKRSRRLVPGDSFERDVFIWFPQHRGWSHEVLKSAEQTSLVYRALRSHYYTSLSGDELRIAKVREQLRSLGFEPSVFKRPKDRAVKGLDIALASDMLSHGFRNNYDVAVLFGGDGDYIPLVEEVKRLGKLVYVAFFDDETLNEELKTVADRFFDLSELLVQTWAESQ
jgi:uncharacterized LabA/DUF88 family protein